MGKALQQLKVDQLLKNCYKILLQPELVCTTFTEMLQRIISLNSVLYISIYKFGLSVSLFVCLFVSNKRQIGWTDRAQIFCGTSRDHREGLWMIKI